MDQPTPSGSSRSLPTAQRRWDPLPVVVEELEELINRGPVSVSLPSGFTLSVYSADVLQTYTLPSETVQITRGSIKYVDHHARYGPQTRFRFQLCHNYLQRKCAKLSECSYIHATALPKPSEVHLNPFAPRRLAADRHGHGQEVPLSAQDDPTVAETYETLLPGYILNVYAPNAGTPGGPDANRPPQAIPTEMIIKTVGGETALAALQLKAAGAELGRGTAGARPRHCAHYQFKRLCNLGTQCHFIHSKVPFAADGAVVAVPPPAKPPSAISQGLQQLRVAAPTPAVDAPPYIPFSVQQPPPTHHHHQHHQQQLPASPISAAAALQQYVSSGAADPNFLAGMQYAAQLLALQQQQQQQQLASHLAQSLSLMTQQALNPAAAAAIPGAYSHQPPPFGPPQMRR